ncbi:MAG TPA: glycoside hydrolase family 3 protein [Propionibacterium sp.]|nr:glycoside hydrolase family 3 protein [Propionibacterium sp.]
MTRRGPWVASVAGVAALALVGCAQVPPGSAPGSPTSSPSGSMPGGSGTTSSLPTASGTGTPGAPGSNTCGDLVAGMSMSEQAAELVMMGVTGDLDAAEAAALAEHGFGSVILMGNTEHGVAGTKERTDAIQEAGGGEVLIAVDQEGGLVRRLRGPGFTAMPSAADQAEMTPEKLTTAAEQWGRQMAEAGVHLDLAPVADVVPADKVGTNEPIGKLGRGYGTTPEAVAQNVVAVVTGFQRAGIAASPKHFPNLGEVVGNTDFAAQVVDDVTTADSASLEPYRQAIAAGVDTVMVGTAWYTQIDPDAPAAFSPTVLSILREDLAFDGVIVSDDLGVAKAVADVPAAERGVRFVRAGGDLGIAVDVAPAAAMVEGLAAAAAGDPALAERVAESATRVLALKTRLGLATCERVVG